MTCMKVPVSKCGLSFNILSLFVCQRLPWVGRSQAVVEEYMAFLSNLVSAQTVFLCACLKMVVSHFTPSMFYCNVSKVKCWIPTLIQVLEWCEFTSDIMHFLWLWEIRCSCLFSERVTICEGGVDISDSDDEDESMCQLFTFKFLCIKTIKMGCAFVTVIYIKPT